MVISSVLVDPVALLSVFWIPKTPQNALQSLWVSSDEVKSLVLRLYYVVQQGKHHEKYMAMNIFMQAWVAS